MKLFEFSRAGSPEYLHLYVDSRLPWLPPRYKHFKLPLIWSDRVFKNDQNLITLVWYYALFAFNIKRAIISFIDSRINEKIAKHVRNMHAIKEEE